MAAPSKQPTTPSQKPKIVIPDDFPPYIAGSRALERMRRYGEVIPYTTRARTEDEFLSRMVDAEVVVNIRAYSKFTREALQRLPTLRMISVLGTGTDNVDLAATKELGITVTNTPGVATEAIAEHALTLMLSVARNIPVIHQQTKAGKWERGLVTQLWGKTLGIVGTGLIGTHMARLGRGIGMNVIAWTFNPSKEKAKEIGFRYVPFDELIRTSDVISLHLRLSDKTQGIIGNREMGMMKSTAILINTARGALIDKRAFVAALWKGQIAGAGLDVYDHEPIPPGDQILQLDRVVLTPHSSGMVPEVMEKSNEMTVENVINFLAGTPVHVV
ncbi:MAG: 3-phosphoglycerate dehydrogenase [Candidatus Latescibacteria bacterium]|nr:3-phosphoglycerate dehydrogenase [Candidatus Latescibacterota bacterium]